MDKLNDDAAFEKTTHSKIFNMISCINEKYLFANDFILSLCDYNKTVVYFTNSDKRH